MLLSNDHGRLLSPLGARITLTALLALAVVVPLLNLAVPPGTFFHVPTYVVSLLGKYLCFALLALSVDLPPCRPSPGSKRRTG